MKYIMLFVQKTLRYILKPLSFVPAVLVMYMIFMMSSQNGVTSGELSYKISNKIIEIGGEVFHSDLTSSDIKYYSDRIHHYVRKLGHVTEYFILAASVAFPLYVYGLRGFKLMLFAGSFCVAFACLDEYHQSFVAGRGPSIRDVGIDSIGIFAGIILVRIVGWAGRMTIFKPLSRKTQSKE